jgi:hypothetical protein
MKTTPKTPEEKMLYRLTRECDAEDFKNLLKKFGSSTRGLEIMQEALDDQLKCEERGNAWESGTDGYFIVQAQQRLLDAECLREGSAFGRVFNEKSAPKAEITVLKDEVAELRTRVNALEKELKPSQPKP